MRSWLPILILALAIVLLFAMTAAPAFACASYSPGYWMNHPEAIGTGEWIGHQWYGTDSIVNWMKTPAAGDKSITAFFIVAAASLDVYGSWGGDRAAAFATATNWVHDNPPGSGIAAKSPEWKAIEPILAYIDSTFE